MGVLPTHLSNFRFCSVPPGRQGPKLVKVNHSLVPGSSTRLIFQLILIESEWLRPCRRAA